MFASALSITVPTPLAERDLQTKIRQALSDKLTGQIHISFVNGMKETIFVVAGNVQQVYIRNHRVPDFKWENPIIRFGRGTIVVEPIPTRAMLFRKILLEEIATNQPQQSGTNQLKTMFSVAEHNNKPTMFHVKWNRAEAFVVVGGKGMPIYQTVMLTQAGAVEGSVALDQISAWSDPQCNVTVHHSDIKNQAWLEVHLNLLFEWQSQNVLSRYGQLTGAVVVRSILQNIAVLATRKGWMISIDNQQIRDTTLFANAAEAGLAYREIMSTIKSHMEPVIGSALTLNVFRQSRDTLRDTFRITEEAFGLMEEVA